MKGNIGNQMTRTDTTTSITIIILIITEEGLLILPLGLTKEETVVIEETIVPNITRNIVITSIKLAQV
jgi:hypothetical protein